MKLTLTISLDNADAQYEDGTLNEQTVAGYVRDVASKLESYETSGSVRDGNGNTIGEYAIWND